MSTSPIAATTPAPGKDSVVASGGDESRRAHLLNRRGGRSSPGSSRRGFTLVEILAVVALIAIAVTIVGVSVGSGLKGARVKAASRDLVAGLRYTRGQAIVKREQQTLAVDVDKRRWRAPGKRWVELPQDMTLKLFTARSELEAEGVGRIRFFPDGSSTGGHIDLLRDDVTWRIEVIWLTGDVKLREGADAPQ
jgi:general secretion pathway protein H